MIAVTVSFPRLKIIQRLWLCLVVVILLLILRSVLIKFRRSSRSELIRLRTELVETEIKESVLRWLSQDPNREFESLRHFETVHFERDIKPVQPIGLYSHKAKDVDDFQNFVTILIFSKLHSTSCIRDQIQSVRKYLQCIRIIVASKASFRILFDDNVHIVNVGEASEGQSLNLMIQMVQTKYFLYLSDGAQLPDFYSQNSPLRLYRTFNKYPDLDILGGSMLAIRQLETERKVTVSCFRLQACDWVMKQSFQYRYIVDDIMACEETTTVFMANHAHILSIGQFDEKLPSLVTTDFLYRAKRRGAIVGVVPGFVYRVTDHCSGRGVDRTSQTELHRPFMKKHDFVELRLASGRVTKLLDVKLPLSAYQWFIKLTHPFQIKGAHGSARAIDVLHDMMLHLDIFFRSRNTLYVVAWGAALASIKMRHLLPYDASIDVDLLYRAPWRVTYEAFIRHRQIHCPHYSVGNVRWEGRNEIIIFDRRNLVVTSLVSHWNDPDFPAEPEQLFMIPLGGRFFPADRRVVQINREYYGLDYLAMKGHDAETMYCSVPGHHACVPLYYAHGGGHWSDFRCQL